MTSVLEDTWKFHVKTCEKVVKTCQKWPSKTPKQGNQGRSIPDLHQLTKTCQTRELRDYAWSDTNMPKWSKFGWSQNTSFWGFWVKIWVFTSWGQLKGLKQVLSSKHQKTRSSVFFGVWDVWFWWIWEKMRQDVVGSTGCQKHQNLRAGVDDKTKILGPKTMSENGVSDIKIWLHG